MANSKNLYYGIPVLILAGIVIFMFFSAQKNSADPFFKGVPVEVFYSEACGCCVNYIGYLRDSGFNVKPVLLDDIKAKKDGLNVPAELRSCHTTKIGRYFVEGHMPVEAVKKLLADKPDVDGIALAGMPSGSPGMPGKKVPFDV